LHVAGLLRTREGLLVEGAGKREIAALAIDIAEETERVRHHQRSRTLVEGGRCLEVAGRLLEATETEVRRAAVRQRQRAKERESGQVGETRRKLQFGKRLHVRPLLEMLGSPVRPDAHDLKHVACTFCVLERANAMGVVRDAVAGQCRQQRKRRVRGGERPRITSGGGAAERILRAYTTSLDVATQPPRGCLPGKQQSCVPRTRVVDLRARVHCERVVESAAQMVDQAESPSESRVEQLTSFGRSI